MPERVPPSEAPGPATSARSDQALTPEKAKPLPSPEGVGRRAFLGRAGAAALGVGAGSLFAPDFLRGRQVEGNGAPGSPATHFDLVITEMSLAEMSAAISSGRLTSRALVEGYLDRIERIDRRGPTINSVLEVNPEALQLADALDRELLAQGPRSRLHGIPILLKDNIGTGDRLHTSAGSLALADFRAPEDAWLVTRLREAGCVILGKANMSEWANARGRGSIGGWSARGWISRNPYVLDRSPGGSSSGTAASVAANLVAAAVGTETMGSIVSPASLCGVVGMKPTVGLVSRRGIIPVSVTQDTPGPMGRTVRDAAILLSVMAGPDPEDPATLESPYGTTDFTTFLDPDALRGARIGVARNLFGTSLHADRVAERALDTLLAAGATLVDPVEVPGGEAVWTFDSEVLAYELKASLNDWFEGPGRDAPVRSLAELIEFNLLNSDEELSWFGQETFLYAQEKGPLTSPGYRQALAMVRRFTREEGIDQALASYRLEAIVAPTQSPAWLIDMLLGDNTLLGAFVPPAAAGYPSLNVPAGDVAGLPVGILFMGTAWSDARLLGFGFAFEQRSRERRPPSFLPTIESRP